MVVVWTAFFSVPKHLVFHFSFKLWYTKKFYIVVFKLLCRMKFKVEVVFASKMLIDVPNSLIAV